MKYLLFISYSNGLMHNALYENMFILHDSIIQLVEEEELDIQKEQIPILEELIQNFKNEDDFSQVLSNGTWYHIQELTERNIIKEDKKTLKIKF